ncbi:MAG: HlyD family efflux transporter periplasmic adaptor subunit [Pseudomonadales bacterium]|nr:HlyD family efflux transporter periplasmic adaptor subunit [Pseudomonadales bacterium]
MLKHRVWILGGVMIAGAALAGWKWWSSHGPQDTVLHIYGNVDVREVQLAFNDADRIAHLYVEEGDTVKVGQLLADLDTHRLQANRDAALARLGSAEEQLRKLMNGSRPEDIRLAAANVEEAQAQLDLAKKMALRQHALITKGNTDQQSVDAADSAEQAALAVLHARQEALRLERLGPRQEDIATQHQGVVQAKAEVMLAEQQWDDARLLAPHDGVIEERILEPGSMVTPQSPVLTLALNHPLWIRAYVPEPDLGRIKLGMLARIRSDSQVSGQSLQGWVGYISPISEFTPKSVETTDLRTQLVYRVRVYACPNSERELRLGMPVTVDILPNVPGAVTTCTVRH